MKKYSCNECGGVGMDHDLIFIAVTHPKTNEPVPVPQCPECGGVNCFTLMCDDPGCAAEATHGWSTPSGYRRACGKHMAH